MKKYELTNYVNNGTKCVIEATSFEHAKRKLGIDGLGHYQTSKGNFCGVCNSISEIRLYASPTELDFKIRRLA